MELANAEEVFRELHLFEKHRLTSFEDWPFDSTSSCSIERMAEAGFYWTGNKRENDTATCFVCGKTLDGWEATDDPWKEHTKHAPQCAFVKYGRKQADLLLEEFLQIYRFVIINKVKKMVKDKKDAFLKVSRNELNIYLDKK